MLVGMSNGSRNGRPLPTRQFNILNGIAQQAATAVVNNHLYREAAERDRLQQELNVAHEIQVSLLPYGCPNIPGSSIASYWQGARQVSGDFYDFIPLANGAKNCYSTLPSKPPKRWKAPNCAPPNKKKPGSTRPCCKWLKPLIASLTSTKFCIPSCA
jgi:hypothetical protein